MILKFGYLLNKPMIEIQKIFIKIQNHTLNTPILKR